MDDENFEPLTPEHDEGAGLEPTVPEAAPDPVLPGDETENNLVEEESPVKPKKPRSSRVWLLAAILFVVAAIGLSVWFGYNNGIQRRLDQAESSRLDKSAQQLELAYQDMAAGKLENAKARIEYILTIYPGFPGAETLLNEINAKLAAPTPAPTVMAVPTLVPEVTSTPDHRGAEEKFTLLQQQMAEQQWAAALETIMSLKETDYDYKTVEVDGYYFIALRNDGVQKIYAGQFEQGAYELAVAEQLGALDGAAEGARQLASQYQTAASYWDTNWPEAVRAFEVLSANYPGLADASGITTTERYRMALAKLGDLFLNQGDPCSAQTYYNRSLNVGQNPDVQVAATRAAEACAAQQAPPATEEPATPDPAVTEEPAPTEAPTEAPAP